MRKSTQNHVRDLLRSSKLHAKKRFGQNYLLDDNILENIVGAAKISTESNVIEIGPGLGSLTRYLVESSKSLLAYEIDTDLSEILLDMFQDRQDFFLKSTDFLKVDIAKDIVETFGDVYGVTIVANLPYYITTPIIMKCLESSERLSRMVFMMQNEVAKRLSAKPNTKAYNALSVMIQYKTNTKYEFKVPRTVFLPAPDVDSAIISMDIIPRKDRPAKDETFLFDFVKQSFKQKRKTLINNLHAAYQIPKEDIRYFLVEQGYKETLRAEGITVNEFVKLSETFREALL
ncbi:MAG: 16S rRNA (adenine(1518)-N(6)/adenine(1519)-N(6))-dimethyltransferase RsmA [Bacillota bacterium]